MGLLQKKDLQSKHRTSTQGMVEAGGDPTEVTVLEEDLGRTIRIRVLKVLVVVEEDRISEAGGAFEVEVDRNSKDKITQMAVGIVVSQDTMQRTAGVTPTTVEEVGDSREIMQTVVRMSACLLCSA